MFDETMDRGRRTTTVRQLELLVEFAEANRDLALGRLRSKEARALSTRLWRECANNLNAEGPARFPKEWAKVWNDLKSRVRTKLTSLTLSQRGTGGGPNVVVTISAVEERVADIIGRDIGPIPNVAQDQLLQAPPDENQAVEMEFVDAEQHEYNEVIADDQLQLHLSGPSSRSPPYQSPPRSTQSPSQRTPPPSAPPAASTLSTPRRHRQRSRQSPRQRRSLQRTSRVHTQALTRHAALDESRAMVMRIEELRAKTDHMLAQAALRQAEAAHAQAEAAKAQAEAALISAHASRLQAESLSKLVPAVKIYLRQHTSRETRRLPSSEED